MSEAFPRGMYFDRANGDMWAQLSTDSNEVWRWINGNGWLRVPKENLDYHSDLPDWY